MRLGQDSPDLPHFAPRQPDETDEAICERKYLWDWDCALLEDLFLDVTRTIARKRVAWTRRMDQRALEDRDIYANAWVLERAVPVHYALVTANRKEIDVKVEATQKQQAQLLAEAFAILGPANPALPAGQRTITLPEGDKTVIDADIIIENNWRGFTAISWPEEHGGHSLLARGYNDKVGWTSNHLGKNTLYNELDNIMRTQDCAIRDHEVYLELQSIDFQTPEGEFDDRADAYALTQARRG